MAVLVVGVFFELLGNCGYSMQGTSIVLSTVSVVMSTIYFFVFLLVPVWLGYKRWTSCLIAYGILFILVGTMGTMGYLGYGFLLRGFASAYFLLVAPFAGVIEKVALSWHIYYAADQIMLFVPLVAYFLAIVSYVIGTVLRAHGRMLRDSLIRLDSRYEYRMPLNEAVEHKHTA